MIDSSAAPPVMPAKAGIHDFLCCDEDKSWLPAFAGMTWVRRRWVNAQDCSHDSGCRGPFTSDVQHANDRTPSTSVSYLVG
jgi:hypothetical protein